jgi:two-component sensor histidine kinase
MKKFTEAIRSEGVPRRIGVLAIYTFALGVLMSVFSIASALNVRSELKEAFAQVARLRDEQSSGRELLRRVVDGQTALRGFALTGEPQYLEPFLAAQASLPQARERYLNTRNAPAKDYVAFDAALDASWESISAAIEHQRRIWPDTSEIRGRMAGIKAHVDLLHAEQSRLDERLSADLENRRSTANETVATLLAALSVLGLGLVLLSFAQLREMALQAALYLRSERKAADEITGLEKAVAVSRSELAWVNRQLAITLRSAGVQVFTLNREGWIDWISDTHSRIEAINAAPCALPDLVAPEDRQNLLDALTAVIERREERDLEVALMSTQQNLRWLRFHFAPQGIDGAEQAMGCAIDITSFRAREQNTFWLMRELSHRSKNLLAIVQSIVRQTARNTTDKAAFLERFSARLQALAASHDLLVMADYAGADLAELIRSQLGGAEHLVGSRITLSGPPFVLRAEAAQNLGMALHELAANALVHGALREAEGNLAITWRIETDSQEPHLCLDWRETGATLGTPANAAGFGDMLIRVNLPRSLEGVVTLEHAQEGTHCTMRLPIRRLKPEFQAGT